MGGNMGVIGPAPPVPPAVDPVVTSISTVNWKDGATGITLTGTDFGDSGASVDVSFQGKNQNDTISGQMSVTAQTDIQITITVVIPTSGGVDQPMYYDALVTHSTGAVSNTTQVLIGPNQTVAGTEHASGLALINNPTDTPQTIIDAEAAGTFFLWTGVSVEKTATFKANDQCIYSAGAEMDGSKKITEGAGGTWTADGNSWKETTQTQTDDSSTSITTEDWDDVNVNSAEFFIALATQSSKRACRMRRYDTKLKAEDADSSATLGSNPIETHVAGLEKAADEVWITQTAHGLLFGEAIQLSGADEVGGITLNGFYTVTEVEDDRFLIQHESNATSAATGGGASVTMVKGIGVFFDSGVPDTVYINIDPTASPTIDIYASTTAKAISVDVGGLIIRGQDDDNKYQIYRYANPLQTGAIQFSFGSGQDNNTFQFGEISRCHGNGLHSKESGHNYWDMKYTYMGQLGFAGGTAGDSDGTATGGTWRRIRSYYNRTTDVDVEVSGGFKIVRTSQIDMDQVSAGRNSSRGCWFDIHNDFVGDGVRRLHSFNNAREGIFMELTDLTVLTSGDSKIYNSLSQDNGWGTSSYFALEPPNIEITAVKGDATHQFIVENCVVQSYDHPDSGRMPSNGIRVALDNRGTQTRDIIVRGNLVVARGQNHQNGFQRKGPASAAEFTEMMDNTEWSNNTYYTVEVTEAGNKVFHHVVGTTNTDLTWAQWKDLGFDTVASGSSITFNTLGPVTTWNKFDMPTWDANAIIGLSV